MRQEAIPIRFVWMRTWGPVALWIVLILTMSGERFGADHTKSWLAPIFLFVFPDIQLGALQTFHLVVRKAAHVIEYGVLGVLAANAFRQHLSEWAGARRVLVTLVLAVGCAAVDEGHQALVLARTGSMRDVLLDSVAAGLGACMVEWLASVRRVPSTSREVEARSSI